MTCRHCGSTLTPRQRGFCSMSCRATYYAPQRDRAAWQRMAFLGVTARRQVRTTRGSPASRLV